MDEDEKIIQLYKEMNEDRKDFSNREWETVKYITTIFAVLLTANITIITYFFPNYQGLWMFSFLPIFMFIISYYGLQNYRREYARLFERVATLMKIEEKIGFHKKRGNQNTRKVLKCDDYYLSKDFVECGRNFDNTKEFVHEMIENPPVGRYGNSYVLFRRMFILYMLISISLFGLLLLLNYFALQ